jgi:hypothetical protein
MNDFIHEHQRDESSKISKRSISALERCQMGYVFGYGYDELFTNQYILKYHYENESNMRGWMRNGYYGTLFKLLEEIIDKGLEEDENLRIFISRMILSFTAIWQNEEDRPVYEWRRLTTNKLREIGIEQHETRMNLGRSNERLLRRNIERGRYVNIRQLYETMKPLKEITRNSIRGNLYGMFKNSWKHEMMNEVKSEEMQLREELFFPHQQINFYFHQIDIYLDTIHNPLSLRLKNSIQLNKLLSFNFMDETHNYRNRRNKYRKDGYIFYFISRRPSENINILKYLSRNLKLNIQDITNFSITYDPIRMIYEGVW